MQTLGNDFVILDRLDSSIYIDSTFVRAIGNRKFGIGFDQLLVLEAPVTPDHDFSFQVFNSNGVVASQCLNGARALISYIRGQNLTGPGPIRLQIGDQSLEGEHLSSTVVRLKLLNPVDSFTVQSVSVDNIEYAMSEVSCGNRHLILWDVRNKDKNRVLSLLKKSNYTFDQFNISFARDEGGKVFLETIERGAGKTLSCGSAALSTYLSYAKKNDKWQNLRIETASGYITIGLFDERLVITGPTHKVFSGEFSARYRTSEKKISC